MSIDHCPSTAAVEINLAHKDALWASRLLWCRLGRVWVGSRHA